MGGGGPSHATPRRAPWHVDMAASENILIMSLALLEANIAANAKMVKSNRQSSLQRQFAHSKLTVAH
jgi:hypothetical protein